MIVGVKKMMGHVGQRLAEEVLVERDDVRVLVGFPIGEPFVNLVERFDAFFADFVGGVIGLSAAADAAAGAGHDLDEVVVAFAFLEAVHHLARVEERMADRDLDFSHAEVVGCFLDAREPAHVVEFQRLRLFARNFFVNGAERRFHDAARRAEDCAGAGACAERAVKLAFRQVFEGKADVADQLDEFAGGQHSVHVAHSVAANFRTRRLEFLRGAGHDGDGKDILDRDARVLRVISLGNRAEHGHRGFRRGKVRQKLRIVLFDEIDPAGAAGSHHRHDAAVLDAVQQLRAFLHDGEVGAEVRVEDPVEA